MRKYAMFNACTHCIASKKCTMRSPIGQGSTIPKIRRLFKVLFAMTHIMPYDFDNVLNSIVYTHVHKR